MTKNMLKIMSLLTLSVLLTACGLKGPLYMPAPTTPKEKNEVKTTSSVVPAPSTTTQGNSESK